MLSDLGYKIKVIFTPMCWLSNDPYSPEWERFLISSLEQGHKFKPLNKHKVLLNGKEVWVDNHPYASFTPCSNVEVRPSKWLVLKLRDILINHIYGE